MGKPRLDPLETVDFRCEECLEYFTAPPETTEDDPDRPWHPFHYTAHCPRCGSLADQDPRQRGLLKAWSRATGPRTPEGIAAVTKNLEGHPTPEETKITRLNSLKHGGYANTVSYFPAKPGGYAVCGACDYFGDVCIENPPTGHKNPKACLKRAELFMRHQIAFDTGDAGLLKSLRAETQAGVQAIIDEMILQIAQDGGPRIKEVVWYSDKDGGFHLAEYIDADTGEKRQIHELKAHPLLKVLIDYIAKNSLTLSDMGMTPKVQQENELLAGHLQEERKNQETALDFRQQQVALMEQLREQIERSQKKTAADPVLIEYNQVADDG